MRIRGSGKEDGEEGEDQYEVEDDVEDEDQYEDGDEDTEEGGGGGRCKPAIRIAAVAGRSASEREKRKLWCCLLMAGDDLRTVGDDMRL